MKKVIILFSLIVNYVSIAQVGIGTNTPHTSAALEILTSNKGFLAPRIALLSNTDVVTISSPATGLMIYNTASSGTIPNVVVPGYYYYNGLKWERLVTTIPDAIVEFNTANPSTGSPVFTPNTPASADYIYVSSVDASQWFWNGSSYVTYVAPASTAWSLANTTNDAGNNKTANIWRSGNVGIGMNNPTVPLEIQSSSVSTYVTAARFLAPNNTTAGNSTLLNFGVSATTGNCADWRYVYQANGAASNRVDFGMSSYSAPMISYLNSGNVGIGTVAPSAKLHIQGIQATLGANANATMLRMSRPTWSGFKWGSAAQFNLGTYDDGVSPVDSKSRLDLALTNSNETTLTNVMTWLGSGNIGINNTAPSAPLVIQGATGKGSLKLIAPSVAAGDNWWLGFGHGTTSTDANDRARIGVDVAAGGPGRLFFTTGPTGTQTRAMFIDESQRVGIGTSSPASKLDVSAGVTTANSIVNATGSINDYLQYNIQNTSTGTQAQSGYSATADNGSATSGFAWLGINNSNFNYPTSYNIGGANDVSFIGSGQDLHVANANNTKSIIFSTGKASTPFFNEQMRILNNGRVGIGTTNPGSRLEVNGSVTNTTAYNAVASSAIDFSNSNLAYTSASPGAFTLTNIKDGGTYTLSVQGSTSGTATFTAAGFTFKSTNNAQTIAGKHTLYTFMVMGTTVYFTMSTGF